MIREYLAEEGIHVTSGDAPGYVPDKICAECHADKAESFAEVAMARSFYRPSADTVIETLSEQAFFHEPTQRLYGMELRNGDYWFTRHTRTPDGSLIDAFTIKVDWIMGSGNHSRVYLYQTEDGALFQLPLAWYSQSQHWGMAPGFEFEDQLGVTRDVAQRCMSCHNAFADYPEGSGESGMPRFYPEDLPEGIGCQRCHGPGAEHVYRAYAGEGTLDEVHAAIVHPGKLPKEELYSICYGCHMQPTVSVNSQLRLGRGNYSFRPGQKMDEFLMHIDIVDTLRTKDERFDINHHPYRMEQSACFLESEGALGCLSCHDPHVKIKPAERAAHYKKACLSCHTTDEAGLPELMSGEPHPDIAADADCTTCHMPERRTQDVIEVTMTDHKITRHAPEGLTDPIPKVQAEVEEIFPLSLAATVPAGEARILQLIAILQHTGRTAEYAADELAAQLEAEPTPHFEPYLHLMQTYVRQGRHEELRALAPTALSRNPDHPRMILVAALAYALSGEVDLGIAILRNLLERSPHLVDTRYNLASILHADGRLDEALVELDQVVEWRPTHWQAWRLMATLRSDQGDAEGAIRAYLRTLEIYPRNPGDREKLADALAETGRMEEAAQHRSLLDP